MAQIKSTPQHCPGYARLKNLKSFTCRCTTCGKEKEVFSDEFDRPHVCAGCGGEIDFTQCDLTGEGASISPR
jgi:rRNA maturation endonuclease Nob1